MDFSDVPDEVLGWVGAGTAAEDPSKARMFFRRALDIYWQSTGEHDTPTLFERKLRRSLASCCFCLRLYQEVLEHTARGLRPPIKDLLVHPGIYGELLDLEHHSFIAVEDFDRGLQRVDEMLSLTPMFPPLHMMRSQLVYIVEARRRQRQQLRKRSKQQKDCLEASTNQETETSEEGSEKGGHQNLSDKARARTLSSSSTQSSTNESQELQMQGPPPFLPYPNNVPADALACIESAFLLDAQDALNCYCQALEIYTRAVGYQAEPSGFEQMTLVLMARCCLELDLLDDVIRHTTRVIRSGSETVDVIASLAYRCQAYELQGDIKKALTDVAEYRVFDPLNKEYIEKHIELEERLKAEEKLDKKETVNGRLELKKLNESKDLSDHSSVTMETKATKNTVCQKAFNREEFYHGQANSGEEAESNEIEQAFLSTSGRESTSMVDVMLLGDFKGGGGNSTVPVSPSVKKKSKKQDRLNAFRRQLEEEKIKQELQEKIAKEQQKEVERTKMKDVDGDQSDPVADVVKPPLLPKKKKKKKKRKRARRKTQTLRSARERQAGESDSGESSDDTGQDSQECDEEKPGATISNSKYSGKFAVLQTESFPAEPLTSKAREPAQKPSPEKEDGANDDIEYEPENTIHILAEIVKRCDLSDVRAIKSTTQQPAATVKDANMRPDLSSGKYVEFRDEVIRRGKLACWICFVKEGGIVTEMDEGSGRCPHHPKNFWTPMLLWPGRHHGSGQRMFNEKWVEIRPRPHDRDGGLKLCDPRKFQCIGALCGYPHSEEEREAWILDRNKWRFRRLPERGRLELCRNYLATNFCRYGDRCLFAHGSEELMEWRLQPNTRDVISELALIRHVKQFVPTWLDDVRREIAEAHNTRQTQVICGRVEGVEIVLSPQNVCFVSSDQLPPYNARFQIEILTSSKDRRLRRVGLIGNGLEFRLRTDCPSFCSSSGLVEVIDGQPPFHIEIEVEFSAERPGCFVQDIVLDIGCPPYVHQSVTVAVVPEKQHGLLKRLCHIFQSLRASTVSRIASVFSDSASVLSAACRTLLHPPTSLDEYKQHLHTVLYIEEIFSHAQLWNAQAVQKIQTLSEKERDRDHRLVTHSVIDGLSDAIVQNQCLLYGDIPRLRAGHVMPESLVSQLLLMIDPGLTMEQKSAVSEVLDPRNYCCILIQGSPGAGKSRVLVEAARILMASRKARILICTATTKSAEQFVTLLHQLKISCLEKELIYMSGTLRHEMVCNDIKRYQRSCESAAKVVSRIQLGHGSVLLVATLNDCCHFLTRELVSFTHVLIDEASRVMEVDTVVALALSTPEAVVVLAGDKNELQPFCHWQQLNNQSLFSRLSKSKAQCNEINLTSQFQCHPVLTRLVSCMLNSTSTMSTCIRDYAHTTFHPFSIFACCGGRADQSGTDGSFCNLMEAEAVVNQVIILIQNWPVYLGNVDASQIFVVSCEQRQLKAIEALLKSQPLSGGNARLSDVRVGTPWELQGLSPRVVIISTVMTEETDQEIYKDNRCFLSDAGMLYSAIYETRCLVLVVGDPYCLISRGDEAVQSMWRVYLQQCCDLGHAAFQGNAKAMDLAVRIKLQSVKLNIGSPEFIPSFESAT